MNEQIRPINESDAGPNPLGSIFDSDGSDAGLVTVGSSPYSESVPVANMSVGEIRSRFRLRFDIDPQSQAVLDGDEIVDETTVVNASQVLTFIRRAGEKGRLGGWGGLKPQDHLEP